MEKESKSCAKCKKYFPNDDGYFSWTSSKRSNGKVYRYLRSVCKFCLSKKRARWYKNAKKSKKFTEKRRVYANIYRTAHILSVRVKDKIYKRLIRS